MARVYDKLKAVLRAHKHYALLANLDLACWEEAKALAHAIGGTQMERLVEAEDYYAEEILDKRYNRQPLTPAQVLNNRRTPTAWAIAEILAENGIDF